MTPLLKNKLEIIQGDSTHVEIVIIDNQPEGNYIYIPETEDEIKVLIYNEEETVAELTADISDPEYVFVNIDASGIPEGKYLYDVILRTGSETYHAAKAQEITIRR